MYTNYAIITDFDVQSTSTLPIKDFTQLRSMVVIDFGAIPQPVRVIVSQNPNNLNGVRVVLDYRGLIPLEAFTLSYTFQEASVGLVSTVPVGYNALSNPRVKTIPI